MPETKLTRSERKAALVEQIKTLSEESGYQLTCAQLADEVGYGYHHVRHLVAEHGIRVARRWRRKSQLREEQKARTAERAAEAETLFRSGMTLREVGERFGVSRERVRQLLASRNVPSDQGGYTAKVRERKARRTREREQAKEVQRQRIHGCSVAEYESVLEEARSLYGDAAPRTILCGVFHSSRWAAKRAGVSWTLTFPQWWALWRDSGKWLKRGTGNGYGVIRIDPLGGFTPDNVKVDIVLKAIKRSHTARAALRRKEREGF